MFKVAEAILRALRAKAEPWRLVYSRFLAGFIYAFVKSSEALQRPALGTRSAHQLTDCLGTRKPWTQKEAANLEALAHRIRDAREPPAILPAQGISGCAILYRIQVGQQPTKPNRDCGILAINDP